MDQPVLIAGPTASGKSALALAIAGDQGRAIVNADALQVYRCWRVLSARPSEEEEAQATHHLYGHVAYEAAYSVGEWLRQVAPLLAQEPAPIIVGGTGLYFRALTEGLAEIPPIPAELRQASEALLAKSGIAALLAEIDPRTTRKIDQLNPLRVQRAWEVQKATGRGLADWQSDTPPALVPLDRTTPILLDADKDWLTARIEKRFDLMLDQGALDEVRAVLNQWDPHLPASKAIGAPELVAHLKGEMTLKDARDAAIISTRQYAKRQRTWFRARMKDWRRVDLPG